MSPRNDTPEKVAPAPAVQADNGQDHQQTGEASVDNVLALANTARAYETSRIKRTRRTHAQLGSLLDAIRAEINGKDRMTIRHLFYRLSNNVKAIEKTENAYKNLCSHLSIWRKSGEIPYRTFVDSTRWHYGSEGHDSIEDALANCAATYRKNLWLQSPHRVEVWCEKETIAGLIHNQAALFGVRVFVCRGFASLSSLHDAAEDFRHHIEDGREVHILYFGDHDPSGVLVDATIRRNMAKLFNIEVDLQRVTVKPDHIRQFSLPTRPTKRGSSHSKDFVGESVEIDAMEPDTIKELVAQSIERFIDPRELEVLKAAETEERKQIEVLVRFL